MNDALRAMLRAYGTINSQNRQTEQINVLREVVQRITLLGLHRGGFFDKASFYGGTALRILYGLDRFSEDLDFCLNTPDPSFQLSKFFDSIEAEHARFGLHPILQEKKSGNEVNIESAFVKQDTCKGLLVIGSGIEKIPKGQTLKVRLEVDKANPQGGTTERKIITSPVPFMVGTLTEPSLFAGKLHAILARAYLNRTKGRDYYDFVFYSSRGTSVNLQYLEAKLRDSGHIVGIQALTLETLIAMLKTKFSNVDFESAKEDVRPFIKPEKTLDLEEWSAALFSALAEKLRAD
jgi:predicted nucleotidyltransferase component of viral defense system